MTLLIELVRPIPHDESLDVGAGQNIYSNSLFASSLQLLGVRYDVGVNDVAINDVAIIRCGRFSHR